MKDFYEGFEDFASAHYLFSFAYLRLISEIIILRELLDDNSLSELDQETYKCNLDFYLYFASRIKSRLDDMFPKFKFLETDGANGA